MDKSRDNKPGLFPFNVPKSSCWRGDNRNRLMAVGRMHCSNVRSDQIVFENMFTFHSSGREKRIPAEVIRMIQNPASGKL